jgi:ADP-ribosylglycohydrolase
MRTQLKAAERSIVLAARYALDPGKVAEMVSGHCELTQSDPAIVAMSTAYNAVLALLVSGEPLDAEISDKLMQSMAVDKTWLEPA